MSEENRKRKEKDKSGIDKLLFKIIKFVTNYSNRYILLFLNKSL